MWSDVMIAANAGDVIDADTGELLPPGPSVFELLGWPEPANEDANEPRRTRRTHRHEDV